MVDVSSQNGNASINVSSGSVTSSINVSSSGVTSSINATPDMALYYSEKSREYSESAKKYADEGKGYLDSAVIIYNDFDNQSSLTLREIAIAKSGALEELNVALNESKDVALNAIENEKDVAIQEIDDAFAELSGDLSDVKIVADNIETVQTIGQNVENILNKTVEVGTTVTGEAGTSAKVENVGTQFAPVLNFTIPQGAKGADGKNGADGGIEIGDIGIAILGIDETKGKRRYLNGQVIIQEQYVEFTKKVKSAVALYPSLACTESEWQTISTMTVNGQVGKFVVDDEAGTIRLPKIIMPIQGLTDLSKLGEIVEAGLPTLTTNSTGAHTHTRGTMDITGTFNGIPTGGNDNYSVSGVFTAGGNASSSNNGVYNNATGGKRAITFTASRNWTGSTSSNGAHTHTITGTADTVQQEQIQYPYFIQVATGAETEDNIINEIELNNPYSLLDVKWSDKLLNNISWLRSEGQANSKAVYNDVYELILKEYNSGTDETETVGGVNITFRRGSETNIKVTTNKSAYDSILSETGTAWYYVLDTANETFYLPQSDGFLQFGGNGDFVEAGLPNIDHTHTRGTMNITGGTTWILMNENTTSTGPFTTSVNYTGKLQGGAAGTNGYTLNFDASRNWTGATSTNSDVDDVYGNSDTVQPNAVKGYLYFYVGETVQNANLVNVGRIEEVVSQVKADKLDKSAVKAYIKETYVNGTSWYRIYSDGWCEQGGRIQNNSTSGTPITYLKPMKDVNYSIITSWNGNSINDYGYNYHCVNATTTGATLVVHLNNAVTANGIYVYWTVKGYKA